jgi:hypothetical protein
MAMFPQERAMMWWIIWVVSDLNFNRTDLKVNQLAASNYFLRIYLTKEPLVFKFEKM